MKNIETTSLVKKKKMKKMNKILVLIDKIQKNEDCLQHIFVNEDE